jgi:hypothetical protein
MAHVVEFALGSFASLSHKIGGNMKRSVLLAGLVVALASFLAKSGGAAELYRIEGPAALPRRQLGVVDGKVYMVECQSRDFTPKRSFTWKVEVASPREKGVLIRFVSSSRDDKFYGWYLSYDLEGKDPRVILTEQAGSGSYWQVDPRGNRSVQGIAAKNGKFKNWWLHVGDGLETDAVLDRNPPVPPVFTFIRHSP